MMGRLAKLLPLLALVPSISAYMPPEESAAASAFMAKYSQYFEYAGPTGAAVELAAAAAKTQAAVSPLATTSGKCGYWMEDIPHMGVAAFNSNSSYKVFRNVKDYGAKGDGVTDDTAAIQAAIADGGRFSLALNQGSTNTPAVVYFPAGTYLISCTVQDYYYTQIIGNPNCLPTIIATPTFNNGSCTAGGVGLIDGDQYHATNPTNIFYRQVRNLILDIRPIPYTSAATGIYWPTAQATSLQNVVIYAADAPGTQHTAFSASDGSAGFLTDVVIHGGLNGMLMGNQQWTMRNITISGSVYCILLGYDWGWTFSGLHLNNCTTVAVDMTSGGYANPPDQSLHSVMIIDSDISNTPVAVNTAYNPNNNVPNAGGTLILENVKLTNATNAVFGLDGTTLLVGGSYTVDAYLQGHEYTPNGPKVTQGLITPVPRPNALLAGKSGNYYTQSKPQYQNMPASKFVSVRLAGAKGDGVHDDTAALQKAINATASVGQILFVDAGTYRITRTLFIPAGARIVGESYSNFMSSGSYFDNVKKPRPVIQVGLPGDSGRVEWSDMIVTTQGGKNGQIGAILIEWNLASPNGNPSGMWDVHTRLGGFIGSNFQQASCPTTPQSQKTQPNQIAEHCYAGFLSLHITASAKGLYLENNWFWTADHDIDGTQQITIYTGRGMLVESKKGPIWLWGTAVEHHALYQYQFVNTQNVFMGQIQTETAYWQPNPNATVPFKVNPMFNDPVYPTAPYNDNGTLVPNADGWGLRAVNSTLYIYGAGLYSFFNNYSTACSNQGVTQCQSRIFSAENSEVYLYDLHTVGTVEMITVNGKDIAYWDDNFADFTDNIGLFRVGANGKSIGA